MKTFKLTSTFICILIIQRAWSSCPGDYLVLDTISQGVVQIQSGWLGIPSTNRIDTVSESMLMKALVHEYRSSRNAAIVHIDTAFRYSMVNWGAESVFVVVDSVINGTVEQDTLRFSHQLSEDIPSYGLFKKKRYIAFFDTIGSVDAGIQIRDSIVGLGYPNGCAFSWGIVRGYFIENGYIHNTGYRALLGVSVPFNNFISAINNEYKISFQPIMCLVSPCRNFSVLDTATHTSRLVAAVFDTNGAPCTSNNPILADSLIVRGYFATDSLNGWMYRDTVFIITEIISKTGIVSKHSFNHVIQNRIGWKKTLMCTPSVHIVITGSRKSEGKNRILEFDIRGRNLHPVFQK